MHAADYDSITMQNRCMLPVSMSVTDHSLIQYNFFSKAIKIGPSYCFK